MLKPTDLLLMGLKFIIMDEIYKYINRMVTVL